MKVFKGGYKIVSLLNIDITSDFTISGIYDDIKDSHGKPILVSEINVGGEKMNDAYTIVKQDNTDYIIEVYGYSLTIASDDSVTVASLPEITSIGEGLTLTDGELSASGGGSQLYLHTIYWYISNTNYGSFNYISNVSSYATLKDVVEDWHSKFDSTSVFMDIIATGIMNQNDVILAMRYYSLDPTTGVAVTVFKSNNTVGSEMVTYSSVTTFEDRVITL